MSRGSKSESHKRAHEIISRVTNKKNLNYIHLIFAFVHPVSNCKKRLRLELLTVQTNKLQQEHELKDQFKM